MRHSCGVAKRNLGQRRVFSRPTCIFVKQHPRCEKNLTHLQLRLVSRRSSVGEILASPWPFNFLIGRATPREVETTTLLPHTEHVLLLVTPQSMTLAAFISTACEHGEGLHGPTRLELNFVLRACRKVLSNFAKGQKTACLPNTSISSLAG